MSVTRPDLFVSSENHHEMAEEDEEEGEVGVDSEADEAARDLAYAEADYIYNSVTRKLPVPPTHATMQSQFKKQEIEALVRWEIEFRLFFKCVKADQIIFISQVSGDAEEKV